MPSRHFTRHHPQEGREGRERSVESIQAERSSKEVSVNKRGLMSTQLDWSFLRQGHLFEREKQRDLLVDAFRRRLRPKSRSELLLVSGSSGTGKTVLALELQNEVKERGGWLILGKFDQIKCVQLYAPIIAAISTLIDNLLTNHHIIVEMVKSSVLKALGSDVRVLTSCIPSLEKLVGKQRKIILKGADVEKRFKSIFIRFMSAMCASSRPLVLVMDDLQWADTGSIELLEGIVSDPNNHNLVVVGICRSNEVSLNHDFAVILRRLEDNSNTLITNIEVQCFSLQATTQLISATLQQEEKLCHRIAHTLHKKTSGNPLFLLELLKSLYENEVLIADEEKAEWLWDEEKWHADFQEVNEVTDLIVQRIQHLSSNCRLFLSTCACLGTEIDEFLIHKLLADKLNVQQILNKCMIQGIICKGLELSKCRFLHDRMQQASYYLINEDERRLFHSSIGRLLLNSLSESELDDYIFVVVDQMSRGIEEMPDDDKDKARLPFLCVWAGAKLIESHDFKTALKYLKLGKSLLDLRIAWRESYDLTLNLHNSIVEASCLSADYIELHENAASIEANARGIEDLIPCYTMKIYALGAGIRLQEAFDLGLSVLENIGEKIPKKTGRFHVLGNFLSIKRMIRGKSDDDIMSLPDMSNKEKLVAMKILNLLAVVTYFGPKDFFPIIVLRMMKLTLKYGLSAISTMAFAVYGILLVSIGDIDGGYRYSSLAITMLDDRYSAVKFDWIPRVHTIHHGLVAHWKKPLKLQLEKLWQSYERSIAMSGDREFKFIGLMTYCRGTFASGCELSSQLPTLTKAVSEMRAANQNSIAEITTLTRETVLTLMGKSDVSFTLKSDAIGSSERLVDVDAGAGQGFRMLSSFTASCGIIVSYHLGDFKRAAEMAELSKDLCKVNPVGVANATHAFYSCLACLTLIRRDPLISKASRKRYLSLAQKNFKYLENRCRHCPQNFQHTLTFLDAEFDALNGKVSSALIKYSKAQVLANREECLNVEALACERAFFTLHESRGNTRQKILLLEQSTSIYAKWGASAILRRMEQLRKDLIDLGP
jgi:predicted ATPase